MRAEHERARREGVLTARQDRLTRRILLSELDELERDLRSIDTLTEKSRIAGSPEQAYVSMLENKEAGHRGYLDNNVFESSRYFARGTRLVWMDMEAKRAMLANGWPLEDLNLLSHLYIRRAILQSTLSDKDTLEKEGEDWARLRERSVKMLDQIIGELERTSVRNAADRKRLLQMIDSYGSNFYTADIIDSDPVKIEQFRNELRSSIEREPEALMFLSDEELADARAAYQRYQDRKNGPDPDRPTVNGPQADIERAFLNTTRISTLYTMRGRLAGTRAFTRDRLHAQTLAQTEAFLSHVEEFYANTAFLSPEQQAARSSAFEALVRESVTLSEQIGKSIEKLTDNNRKKNYSEAEQKQLDALTSMQDQVRHMRSLYTAHIDLENRRRRDLPLVRQAELERETQRIAAEQEKHRVLEELETGESGREVLVTEDGEIYARLNYLMRNMLTDEEVQFLIDAYEGEIPTVLRVQDIDGRLLPRAVVDGHRQEAARREAALQAEQSRKSKERAERRKERQQEDFTEAAVDLFRQEEQKLMDSDPLKEESKRLAGEILEVPRNAKKQEAKRRVQDAERRERIEAIATDERYDEETRRALIEAIETEDRYDWEGNLKELKAQKRAVDEQLIEKYQGISRRRMQALDTGDERYTWSFRHILQDVFDRKTADKQAYQDAKGKPESVPEITRKGILAYDEEKRYDRMMSIVGAALDPDKLREALRVKWPEWSAQVLDPLLTGKSGAKMTGVIIDRMKATLPPGEAHAFLDEQLRAQREDIREDARRNLLTLQLVTELPEEEQVSHLLHERVEELKRKGLVDDAGHLLDERGVPYPPEVEQGEILKDESGIPYPPESPVLQAYQRRKAYREALEYADSVVTQTGELAVAGNIAHRKIEESARSEELKRDVREGIAAYPEEEMRTVANNLLKNGTSFVADGVQPGQEEYRDRILNTTYDFSQEHLGKIAGMLKMMEEMQLPVGNDMPGGTGANRAYSVLLDAREMLRQAVVAGDEEWILQAKADYEKAKKDIDTLNAYAQDEANFPAESIPGNIDSTRDRNLPLEYSRDYYTNSKLNAMHNLYSVMKWAGIPIARLTEDPNAVIRDLYRKVVEEFDLNKQSEGKSFGTLLGEMASEDIEKHSFKLARCSGMQDLVSRCVDAIIMMDPDPNARKKNELTESLQSMYQNRLLGHRSSYNNPKKDQARWDDVQQLLSLVDEETFAKNPAKFLMIRPLDDHGFPEQPTTAASFVAGIGEDFFGYPGLMNRAEEILTDAGRLAGSQFDPVRFMQNRQKALSTLLIARAADRYKVGFSVLEDEILHMADYYESIRQANPDAKLPALTEAERQSFTVQAAQFAENMENAYRSLSDDAKEMVDMRRDARQEEEEAYRESGTIIPTDHRERVLWEMDQLGIRPAARPQQNGPVPPVPPVQADPGQRGPAVIVPPVQDVPGSVAADGAGEKAPMGALATQLEKNFLTNYEAVHLDSAMTAQGFENSEPEQYYDSVIDMYDAETRFRYLYVAIRNDYDKDRLALALVETYGATEGARLFAAIGGKVPQPIDLFRISGEDRRKLFGAMAGYLPLERQEELLAADKAFRPIREIDTSSEITLQTGGDARTQFEEQVDHPARERVKNLTDEAGLDWKKMSGGKGTQEELNAFRRDLADADALLAEVKSELKDRVAQVRGAQAKRGTRRYNLIHRKGNEKPENRYLQDLFVTEKDVKVSREDRQADLKRTARSNPHFDKDYIRNVAAMLHRMQEMHLLSNETRSEEQFKVYAFRDIVLARAALRDALAADMTVEENRKKLAEAVKRLKTAQKGMDELIRMAKENFSQTGYMDNLDTSRNVAVPWQYSRNLVTTSQVNAVWMFGNLLLQNGISIEEFEKDPDRVIERLKTHALEEGATLKGVTRGKSMGEIAVLGATNYFDGQLVEANNRLLGQYSRGVDGLIEGDPADNTPNKEHNQYLYMQNIYGYASDLHHAARKNARRLTEGFQGRDREGFEAIKTLTVVAPEDFDPDGMLLKVPVNTDGSRREPFRLGNYLRDKDKIDYQAQIGRLDRMLEDAAKTYQRICREEETENLQPTGKYPGVVGGALRTERYTPFPLVQARQQALAEMLALRPEDASDPAYAQLEDEVLNAAQKYDALRKARPELNLPELTGEQKKTLEEQKKNYLNIRNNREKLMGRIEDRMAKGVRQEEKTFNTQAKSLADQIRKLKERIGRREAKIAQAEEKIRRAAQGGNDRRRQAAVSEKEALEREKRTFDEQLAGLEQSLESLRVDRMKTLTAQYRDGKLPYGYVDKRLRQIDEGREQEELPKLFGDPHNNEEDREARKTFLNDKIFEESGTDLDTKPDKVDHPLNWTIWNHTFWTEEEKAAVDLGNQEELISPEETVKFSTEEQEIAPTSEEIRQEGPKEEAPKQEVPKQEAPKEEAPKQNPPEQVQNPPEPQNNAVNDEERQREKIETLMKYPPKRRAHNVHAPIRHAGSGEILIRSHDMDPNKGDYDPGDETLPREILNTGDLEMLRLYREIYRDSLLTLPDGAMYVEYLDQRIAGLEKIDRVMKEIDQKTRQGQITYSPVVTTAQDGTITVQGARQREFQTASNSCWSVALSNLLDSRGVSLTQKDIRSFRATKPFTSYANANDTNEFNNDIGSDPFHDSELVMKTVPNTAMHLWGFEEMPPAQVDKNGAIYRDATDDTAVKAIREQVEYALRHDRSPVAIKYGGHYQTIVGIKGNTLILRDSLKPSEKECIDEKGIYHEPNPNRTIRIDLYDVVRKVRRQAPGYPRDLSLVWLSELHKDPITGEVEETKHYPNLKFQADGKLTQTQEPDGNTVMLEGTADTGCWSVATGEKDGLRPVYQVKFPNEIRMDLLRKAEKPSRTPAQHLTIPDAKPSAKRGQIVDYLPGRRPGEVSEGAGEFLGGEGSFWNKEDGNALLFGMIAQVCYDNKGNLIKGIQMVADSAYSVTNEAQGHLFAQNLIQAIQAVPSAQRSDAQELALDLARDRMNAWKPAEQVRDISIDDVYRKTYGNLPPKGTGSAHHRTAQQIPGQNTAGTTHENKPGGMQNRK
ncbi:MAG: hypothetical protein II800_10495 [Lachnospiraceae bacterium]|nr:hypothetical protein [Lachnospiraceae bacterium]